MALNIATKLEKSGKSNTMTRQFMVKHHITVNEPVQAHFSVQGVQTYSRQEVLAMKMREDRLMTAAQKQGTYIQPQSYKLDDEIQFEIPTVSNEAMSSFKAKSKKTLQTAKPNDLPYQTTHKIVKPSIRNQIGRANQKLTKLDKQAFKKQKLQKKLQQLSKKYKEHFGDDLKPSKKLLQQKQSARKSSKDGHDNNQNFAEFRQDENEGDQCLPQIKKPAKSIATGTRAEEKGIDDSFEQIQWQKSSEPSKSRLNASTYSQKLGNAVHSLFD